MSSPNTEQDTAVLSSDEQELSKEERLEAARKKFEELKKKKKKSKKKSKKGKEDKDEDTVENDDTDSKDAANDTHTDGESKEVGGGESKEEDKKLDEKDASKEPEKSEKKEVDTTKDENKSVKEELKEDLKVDLKEDLTEDLKKDLKEELKEDLKEELKEDLKKDLKDELTAKGAKENELKMESVKSKEFEVSKKDSVADNENNNSKKDTSAEVVTDKVVDIGTETLSNDKKKENRNDEKTEIQNEAKMVQPKDDNIDSVTSVTGDDEVASLKATIEQQKSTIKKLRDENTDLKLSRMDLQDRIVELESQLKNVPQATSTSEVTKDSRQKQQTKPAKPVFTQNDYASVSQQNFASFSHTNDFREKLMVWKGWQVDMRLWNATNNTQKISL